MKLPSRFRKLTQIALGLGNAESIAPDALQELAQHEDVLVLSVGMVGHGPIDDRLPGEQRGVSLATLVADVKGVDKARLIVTHCG